MHKACSDFRDGIKNKSFFDVSIDEFSNIPGKPFAYWVSNNIRSAFIKFPSLLKSTDLRVGVQTSDDFRFLRLAWEINEFNINDKWKPLAKGGGYSPFYGDINLRILTEDNFAEIVAYTNGRYPYLNGNARSFMHADARHFFQPGFTWTYRPSTTGSFRALPEGSVFGVNGSSGFIENNDFKKLLGLLALLNSKAYNSIIKLLFARGGEGSGQTLTYEVGYVGDTPIPDAPSEAMDILSKCALEIWASYRLLDSTVETSSFFLGPKDILARHIEITPEISKAKIAQLLSSIDQLAFNLYEFSEVDKRAVLDFKNDVVTNTSSDEQEDSEERNFENDDGESGLSWAIGVAFGRFSIRLRIPDNWNDISPSTPFKKNPIRPPSFLLSYDEAMHPHKGVLVDDAGNRHDLPSLVEKAQSICELKDERDIRKWLRNDFFKYHLKIYSKSRRKAPIYWPLSTSSGSYTLWLYYTGLTSQTLYTAINDFVEPKLKQVGADVTALRNKGSARTRDEEKQFETLQAFELELIELRDTLLKLAPTYKPNHDDGVQISAAPLWPLFRHKPWQKVLKDTWAKLEKGDYDWAHLAMNYWPDRVREKCKTDKSLAIAHGLEHLYVEPEAQPKKQRGRKKAGGDE